MSQKFVVSITCLNLKQNEIQIKRWKNFKRRVAAIKKTVNQLIKIAEKSKDKPFCSGLTIHLFDPK